MKAIITYLIILLFFTACDISKNDIQTKLEHIDSLLIKTNISETEKEMGTIRFEELKDDADKAKYLLLKAQLSHVKGIRQNEDSALDFSINYYKNNHDAELLARSYYYKGAISYENGNTKKALLLFKEAEQTEKEAGVPWLKFLIYVNMSYVNFSLEANETALDYAHKALQHAINNDNVSWECFAYNSMAMSFYGMGKKDSAFKYINKIEPHLKEITDKEECTTYMNNIGYIYYENRMYDKARLLFTQALSIEPNTDLLVNLMKTDYMLGMHREADSIKNKIWDQSNAGQKAEILLFLAEKADREKDFKASARYYHEAKVLEDSIKKTKDTEGAVTTQRDYDKARYEQDVNRNATAAAIATIAVVAALGCWGAAYHRRKINKAKKTIADADRRIREYEERMAALELADRKHSDEAVKLERKIRRLKEEQNAVINRGQTLYNHIISEGTTATWKKKDFDEFIEYYRVGHPETVEEAEQGYKGLTSTNIFYLIITNGMKYDDAAAQRIMCMTQGAMRTMKSRIKAKKAEAA